MYGVCEVLCDVIWRVCGCDVLCLCVLLCVCVSSMMSCDVCGMCCACLCLCMWWLNEFAHVVCNVVRDVHLFAYHCAVVCKWFGCDRVLLMMYCVMVYGVLLCVLLLC